MSKFHQPVLIQEVINALNVEKDKRYIDGTIGGGGHSFEIISRGGVVLGIDVDEDAISFVKNRFAEEIGNKKLILVRGNFRNIDKIAEAAGFERVQGILLDIGVSSHQIDTKNRGFSYLSSGPLDMRMDQRLGVKASDLLNALGKSELYELFRDLGEEHRARKVVDEIIIKRKTKSFETVDDLMDVLLKAYGFNNRADFAKATSGKKVFQALRIAVNDELGSLKETLPKALRLLESKGRLVVISFHSLEDRIVKHAFEEFEREGLGSIKTNKPIIPSESEALKNSRSKSSKLRIFEKI